MQHCHSPDSRSKKRCSPLASRTKIRAHKVDKAVEVVAGQSVILTETEQANSKEKGHEDSHGVMVILSPTIIASSPLSMLGDLPRAATKASPAPAKNASPAPQPAPREWLPIRPATFDAPAATEQGEVPSGDLLLPPSSTDGDAGGALLPRADE